MKKDIQHILDGLVDEMNTQESESTYMGVPIGDLTKVELMAVMESMMRGMASDLEQCRKLLDEAAQTVQAG